MKISYQHQTTLKKIKTMTELFESTLKARNIKFTKSLENKGISEYKILSDSLEGIIWLSDSDESAKFFINIPYANFQIYSSHWVIINKDFLAPFESLLDEFVHQLEAHSNRFKEYMGAKTTPPPAPISPQPFSPSTPKTIFEEKGFKHVSDSLYEMSNDYLVAYINIGSNGKRISFTMLAKPTFKQIYIPYYRSTDEENFDKILDNFIRQIESYTKTLSLIEAKLAEIKELCDDEGINYGCLDMSLNRLRYNSEDN